MGPKVSPTPRPSQPLAPSSHLQHSSKYSTTATPQHIDLQALHASFCSTGKSTGHTLEKLQPQQVRAPRLSRSSNLSASNKELVLALGLEEVYKHMAESHKFHIDVVREVAASQQSLENADQVLCSMHKAAEHEYARLMKQEFDKKEGEEGEEDASN
jgi:hypothetical protein